MAESPPLNPAVSNLLFHQFTVSDSALGTGDTTANVNRIRITPEMLRDKTNMSWQVKMDYHDSTRENPEECFLSYLKHLKTTKQ